MKKHYPITWMVMGIIFVATSVFSAPIGKVTLVEGRVDVLKAGRNVATPVSLGAPVDPGDVYRAKSNGRAEITFTNKNLMRIAPKTRIEITRYSVEGDKSNTIARLYRGRAQAIGADDFIKKAASFAEGNRFEVHTPNAVAGIRGTNMVVIFEKGATGAVFLSGQGYMYNPQRPQQVVLIVAGTISFISSPGATPTPPRKASDAEMAMYANAFTQGSSGGDGGTPAGLAPVPGGGGGSPGAGDKMPILNPPPPVIAPATQTTVEGPFYSCFNTDIWQIGSGLLWKGGLSGAFEGTESLWGGSSPLVTISGTYANSATGTSIWSSKVDNTSDPYSYTHPMWSWNETAQTSTTSDGGSYVGFAGGADYNGVLEGRFVGLYIDPSKNAGTLSAPVSGTYAEGIFAMLGPVSRTFKNTVSINPVDFQDNDTQDGIPQSYLSGTFPAMSGTMSGSFGGTILSIDDNPWGIYFLRAGGVYSLPAPSWNAKLGGYTKFGAYYTASSDLYHDNAYWIGNITNGSWGDDKITGTLNGQYVSERRMGTITGDVIGTHNSGAYGSWQAVSPGTWTGIPLSFGNWVNPSLRYYNQSSGWQTDGSFNGNMGGTSSIWSSSQSGPASFKIIAQYNPPPAGTNALIWNDGNHSRNDVYNGSPDYYTTYDGGSYDMNIGAIMTASGNIFGKFAGISIDPYGHAALLRGGLNGTSYTDIGMLDVDGSIYRIEKGPVYLAPNQLRDAMVQHGALSGRTTRLAGTSPEGGKFTGATTDTFDNDFISFVDEANKITYPWGYYRHTLGGSYTGTISTWTGKTGGFHYFGDYYETPTTHTGSPGYWLADITSGTWTSGTFGGTTSGTFLSATALGTISGDVIGTYSSGNSSWQAVSTGVFEGTPLQFISYKTTTTLKWTDISGFHSTGNMEYHFGSNDSLFGTSSPSTASVTLMGKYTRDPSYPWNLVWWGETYNIISFNYLDNTYVTYDGGAFSGYLGGVMRTGTEGIDTLDVHVYTTYVDASQNAGIVKINLSGGGFYVDNGLMFEGIFKMSGSAQRAQFVQGIGILPADLVNSYDTQQLYYAAAASGDITFPTAGTSTAPTTVLKNLTGEQWGIFQGRYYGGYTAFPPSNWTAAIEDLTEAAGIFQNSRLFGMEFSGTQWSDGKGYATSLGYGATTDSTPSTWVSIGELVAGYDADRASATQGWQAIHTGVWLETSKFLAMAATAAGRTELQKINVPCVEVGVVDLYGSWANGSNTIDMTQANGYGMKGVKFFRQTANPAEAPAIWAANSVSGGYTGNPGSASVSLSGAGGIAATLSMKSWNTGTGKWLATVTNGNAPSNAAGSHPAFTFKGAAAGTINTPAAGKFSGVAAGTAK